jgi:hypothetical protein
MRKSIVKRGDPMFRIVRRGYVPNDEREFRGPGLETLSRAKDDFYNLLNRGYPAKVASTFVGNHYLLSERQRLALTRIVSSENDIRLRKEKELKSILPDTEVNVDGFNTIITLEVALSGSPILKCMDGTVRDLAGLRGTYRIIDKTEKAVRLILQELMNQRVSKANFYLDAPVSNSGRLKVLIAEIAEEKGLKVNIEIINAVDSVLESLSCVISSDAIILDKCKSWINLNRRIVERIGGIWEVT